MPIKLSTNDVFIPDVWLTFVDDKGGEKIVNNRKLKAADQIKAHITIASAGEKSQYLDRTNETDIKTHKASVIDVMEYDAAVVDKCNLIEGLEEYKIKTGADLVKHPPRKELNDLIYEIYHKVVGTHTDDVRVMPQKKSKRSA